MTKIVDSKRRDFLALTAALAVGPSSSFTKCQIRFMVVINGLDEVPKISCERRHHCLATK